MSLVKASEQQLRRPLAHLRRKVETVVKPGGLIALRHVVDTDRRKITPRLQSGPLQSDHGPERHDVVEASYRVVGVSDVASEAWAPACRVSGPLAIRSVSSWYRALQQWKPCAPQPPNAAGGSQCRRRADARAGQMFDSLFDAKLVVW